MPFMAKLPLAPEAKDGVVSSSLLCLVSHPPAAVSVHSTFCLDCSLFLSTLVLVDASPWCGAMCRSHAYDRELC